MSTNQQYPAPTVEEHTRFMLSFLFGGEMYPTLKDCVRRANLDLARTVHGINGDGVAKTLRLSGHALVERQLAEVTQSAAAWCQDSFDGWHRRACLELVDHFCQSGYSMFYIGQAQKWLNMAVKYALTLQPLRMLSVAHAGSLRQVAHVPIDNFILEALKPMGVSPLTCAWSRIADYAQYIAYQEQLRFLFSGSALLDVEFHEWNAESRRRRNAAVSLASNV
jgi:hypothetical protein